ncbi:MAG: hypothetical protein ACYDEQ_04815 [Desulfocucumaceae bacterium]
MVRKAIGLLAGLLLMVVFIAGCQGSKGTPDGELKYEIVSPEALKGGTLRSWYQTS